MESAAVDVSRHKRRGDVICERRRQRQHKHRPRGPAHVFEVHGHARARLELDKLEQALALEVCGADPQRRLDDVLDVGHHIVQVSVVLHQHVLDVPDPEAVSVADKLGVWHPGPVARAEHLLQAWQALGAEVGKQCVHAVRGLGKALDVEAVQCEALWGSAGPRPGAHGARGLRAC